MNAITVPQQDDPQVAEQSRDVGSLLQQAEEITIDSNDMYEVADAVLSAIHARAKALDLVKSKIIDPIMTGLKNARALFSTPEERLDIAKRTLKRKMASWQDQLRIAKERADREAEDVMRKEREAAQASVAAAEDAFAAAPSDDTSAALEDAHAASQIADVTLVQPRSIAMPVGNAGKGEEYVVEPQPGFKNLAALLRFIADDLETEVPRFDNTIDLKISQLKAYAKATKGTKQIPGCVIRRGTKIIAR